MATSRMVGRGFKDRGQVFRPVTRPINLSAVGEEAVRERQVEESPADTRNNFSEDAIFPPAEPNSEVWRNTLKSVS